MDRVVVHVGGYNPDALDGVAATLVGQCDALQRLGLPLEIWGFDPTATEPSSDLTSGGIRIHRLPRHRNPLLAAVSLPAITRRWIEGRLADIALFHLHSVFVPTNNLLANLGKPYVVSPNGGWGPQVAKGRSRLLKALWIFLREKHLWFRARWVQAVSETEIRDLAALPGMARVHHIPNGVSLPPLPTGDPVRDVWLFLGRLAIEHKGLDRLVAAYADCRGRGIDLPKLVLAGPDFRGGRSRIEQIATEHGVLDRIELPGPVTGDAKRRLFERSALFLHTSRWEGMPLSILEAMAHGVPCLLTEGTTMVPIIREHECGLDAGDSVGGIAAALESALTSDLKGMGERARDCVKKRFSWSSVATELKPLYEAIDREHPAK